MKTVHAVYADGVFRPKERVELPESCEVEFEPRPVVAAGGTDALADVYQVLGERYDPEADNLPVSPLALEIERMVGAENTVPDEA